MPVKQHIDYEKIKRKAENPLTDKGLEMLATQVRRDCNMYCKEDTGTLIASSMEHSRLDKGLIIWQTPYAARQYYEIPTAYKDVNPNATWRWAEVAKHNHGEKWLAQAKAIARLYG